MNAPGIRALRLPLIRLIALLGGRRSPAATTRTIPLDVGRLSAHMQQDLGLDR